jgi:hypothetical protein
MLRALLALLLLANALFFGWTQGWFAPAWPPPGRGDREPARLAAQVRPDSVVVLGQKAASAALVPRPVCLEAGPLGDAEIEPAVAALAEAGFADSSFTRERLERPARWAVYFGRFADPAALRAKEAELAPLSLPLQPVTAPAELAPGLMLAPVEQRDAADQALAALVQRGVRTARIVPLPATPVEHWLRVPQADADVQARLAALKLPALAGVPGAGFIACAKPP